MFLKLEPKGAPKVPLGHPATSAGPSAASKCPFLAAEMGQKNSSVVRQARMELQEDVSEVRTVCKGLCGIYLLLWDLLHFHQSLCELSVAWHVRVIHVSDVPQSELKPLVNDNKVGGNLMRKLMKQQPTSVSHLLQENMPKSKSIYTSTSCAKRCAKSALVKLKLPLLVLIRIVFFSCSCLQLSLWWVLWEENRGKEEWSHISCV